MMKNKKTPQRTCVVCRTKGDKRDFIRVVRSPDGEILIETDKRLNGRGAYLCKTSICMEKAQKTKALDRALGTKIDEDLWSKLQQIMMAGGNGHE